MASSSAVPLRISVAPVKISSSSLAWECRATATSEREEACQTRKGADSQFPPGVLRAQRVCPEDSLPNAITGLPLVRVEMASPTSTG